MCGKVVVWDIKEVRVSSKWEKLMSGSKAVLSHTPAFHPIASRQLVAASPRKPLSNSLRNTFQFLRLKQSDCPFFFLVPSVVNHWHSLRDRTSDIIPTTPLLPIT